MRKSFDTLAALVKDAIGQHLSSGSLFLFVSKNRKRAEVLHFDGETAAACRKKLIGSRWSQPLDRDGQPVSTGLTYRCRFQIER